MQELLGKSLYEPPLLQQGRGNDSCGIYEKLEFQPVPILHYGCNHLPILDAGAHQVHQCFITLGKDRHIVPES